MKRKILLRLRINSGMMFLAMLIPGLLLLHVSAVEAVTCSKTMSQTVDSDGDGFTDYQECYGLTLSYPSPSSVNPYCGAAGCGGNTARGQTIPTRANRLDPNSKDLFVIVAPASGSLLTQYFPTIMDALQYITNPVGQAAGQGGLGVVVHLIGDSSTRHVSAVSPQKAIRIGESLDMSDPLTLGISNYGTPNGIDFATIFTQRIVSFIDSLCANGTTCVELGGTQDLTTLKKNYIKHVIAHEVGHVLSVTNVSNADFGGYHYKSGTNVIMDQSIYYTSSKSGGVNTITYYTGTNFTADDQTIFKMK